MANTGEKQKSLQDFAQDMKRDWDYRAKENAKWFINTFKLDQSDEEFYSTGEPEVEKFILSDPILNNDRNLKSLRLLEIGCGIGRMTKRLAQAFAEVHATDVSAEMIIQARRKFQDDNNIFFYETNGFDFSGLPSDHFDIIFSVYVFQHVPSVDVIHCNIRDACRVLKPGGVFKFQTSGITTPDFEKIQKDTWTGAPFTETDIRRAARENGVRLVSIDGLGTQYCWTILHKPQTAIHNAPAPGARPEIKFFGRSDAPEIKAIPVSGDHAHLKLVLSGLDPDAADANNVTLEIGGQEFLPCAVSPVEGKFFNAARASGITSFEHLIQIGIGIPSALRCGVASVRVKHVEGVWSEAISLELLEPQPSIPKIELITNVLDGGVDVYARGEKSVFRVFADGLDDTATPDNVGVLIGEYVIKPVSVNFLPGNGVHMIIAQMPEHISAGEAKVRIQFRDLLSESTWISILG